VCGCSFDGSAAASAAARRRHVVISLFTDGRYGYRVAVRGRAVDTGRCHDDALRARPTTSPSDDVVDDVIARRRRISGPGSARVPVRGRGQLVGGL